MKKVLSWALTLSIITTGVFAHAGNSKKNNSHEGDHMHNGKMMNHSNPNGMTDKQMHMMKKKKEKIKENSHMGDHMHNGKMMNHSNPDGMTDKQMHMMKKKKGME